MSPQTGSVYKLMPFGIVIIDGVRTVKTGNEEYEVVDWIAFDMRNSRGTIRMKSYHTDIPCGCTYNDTYGDNSDPVDPDCGVCNGTGIGSIEHSGFEKSTFIAHTCKEYIINTLTKPFNF